MVDQIPTLMIDDQPVMLAEPPQWYEYGWNTLPLLLKFIDGALGGLVGGYATVVSGRILRSDRGFCREVGAVGGGDGPGHRLVFPC